ncbi:ASCH domain-containing protein [Mesorhizobium sp. LHD-90]|uniref:ASCH domain-containing protein n=1 Tax=Mesorhizobium sp. LHD-90 TaxID=3071414 RepID=UPI0027E0620C|nr:ASCH domain-containing protein [Mesorhizobium sp. LHD-90]MDQ6435203.1 ASCH domain-containing protein [Mesorhizobium sp. LHD-90]
MLFKQAILDGIAAGAVTLAFRRWKQPTVKAGGRLRSVAGAVRIGMIAPCSPTELTEADACAAGFPSLAALRKTLGPDNGDPVYRIALDGIEPDERVARRETAEPSEQEWADIRSRFERWEKAAPGYFPSILRLIAAKPMVAASGLATALRVEKLKFKQDVRKLKELGLTESLDVGYRLSRRGESVLARLKSPGPSRESSSGLGTGGVACS